MSDAPADLRYSQSHEWYRVEDGVVTIGITAHAVEQLTDVTFVEMKPVGTGLAAGDAVGEVESVKTTSEIYSAVAGEIVEVNGELSGNEGLVNEEPYGKGWLVRVKMSDEGGLEALVDAETYLREHAV